MIYFLISLDFFQLMYIFVYLKLCWSVNWSKESVWNKTWEAFTIIFLGAFKYLAFLTFSLLYCERLLYTLYTKSKYKCCKKFPPSDKINVTKNALILLSRAPTHYSFTFNSQVLYGLKHKFHLCKTVIFSIFDSALFLFKFIFLFSKKKGLFDFKMLQFLSK